MKRFVKVRKGRAAAGLPVMARADRVQYDEAAKDLRVHYEATGSRDLQEVETRLVHLDRFFAGRRLVSIGPPEATAYVVERQTKQASNGSVNRELALLNRMLRLAYENGKLMRLPVIRKLKEAPPREGFFEREQFEAVRRRLDKRPDLQTAITLAYTFGWRMQSEVVTLERRHLDLEAGTLRLDPGATRNDEGRVVYLTPELKTLLAAQVERVKILEREAKRSMPVLFPRLRGRRRGEAIRDFRKAWARACKSAGVPGMLRHDFQRTARCGTWSTRRCPSA